MVVSLALAVCMAKPIDTVQMAFVARFYTPVGSKTKSGMEVYVCSLDGKHLKRLTTNANALEVRWIGHNRLAYQTPDERGYWTIGADGSDRKRVRGDLPAFDYDGDGAFRLSDAEKEKWFTPYWGSGVRGGYGEWAAKIAHMPNAKIPAKHCGVSITDAYFDRVHRRVWLVYQSADSTCGGHDFLATFTASQPKPRFINPDAREIDLIPDRKVFACVSPREPSPYGKISVWESKLYVGDWTTGRCKELKLAEHAWYFSVAIRP